MSHAIRILALTAVAAGLHVGCDRRPVTKAPDASTTSFPQLRTHFDPATDWPQWRGPQRTGVSAQTGLLNAWPAEGPPLLWKATNIGEGYSTPSIAAGRVYLLSHRGEEEFAVALDARDGNKLWSVRIGRVGLHARPKYPGARSTPTIDGDRLYTLSSDGDLVCLETAAGKERWRRHYIKDFHGQPGIWEYAESLLIDGDLAVGTPGGAEATLIALHKHTGELVWRAATPEKDAAAYSSAVIAEVGPTRQYVQFLDRGLVGIEANSGRVLWRYDRTCDMRANVATPIVRDHFVFSSTSGGGGALVRLEAENGGVAVREVWHNRELANTVGGVVLVGEHLYGTGSQALVCMEFMTGKVCWKDRSVGVGAVCAADGHLCLRGENGLVALVEATPGGYREKGRFMQPGRSPIPPWPHPVVANGCLYLRDQGVLLCYDVRKAD